MILQHVILKEPSFWHFLASRFPSLDYTLIIVIVIVMPSFYFVIVRDILQNIINGMMPPTAAILMQ